MYYNAQKKRILLHFLVLILFAVLQGLFIRFFDYFWGNINVIFVYFIFLSFYLGKSVSYKIGFVFGLILDCFGMTYGLYTFLFTVLGYLTGMLSGKFYLAGFFIPVLYTLAASVLYFFLAAILLKTFFEVVWIRFLINAGIQTLIGSLLSPFIAYLFRRYFFKRVGIIENGK